MRSFIFGILGILVVLLLCVAFFNHASPQIAFMGDSLTQGWTFPTANFGIFGQTTAQMEQRFPAQIPGHNFRRVVILGGTNDTLLHLDPEVTVRNLGTMVDQARAAGVEPILAEIPPIYRADGQFLPAVDHLNAEIVDLAGTKQVKVVDYYHPLLGNQSAYSDGVHLKRRGYLQMELALIPVAHPF